MYTNIIHVIISTSRELRGVVVKCQAEETSPAKFLENPHYNVNDQLGLNSLKRLELC